MELKTKAGLLNLWIFIMFLVVPCRTSQGCNVTNLVQLIKSKMRGLLNTYLKDNGPGINLWPHPIEELEINSSDSMEKKIQKVLCGFVYVQDAFQLIEAHQRRIHNRDITILMKLDKEKYNLKNVIACVSRVFNITCQNKTQPDFPHLNTYSQKQWGRSVLETFLLFLDDAVDVVKHGDKSHQKPTSVLGHKLKHA